MACRSLKDVYAAAITGLIAATIGAGTAHADFPDSALAVHPTPIAAPAGAHAVGRVDTEVRDADRDLMVSAWYPATETHAPAPYVPAADPIAQTEIAARSAEWMHLSTATAAMVGAQAAASENAPIDGDRLPVVLVSPGMGTPRWILSGLAAELASRGVAVIVMDHTGESPAVQFPDGRIVFGDAPTLTASYMRDRLAARIADTRTVLDQLPTLPVIGAHLDTTRVAAIGHSYGGTTAVQAMAQDSRITAAISIDGPAGWDNVATAPATDRPTLFLNLTSIWADSWTGFDNTRFDTATMASAGHYSAADLCAFTSDPQLCGTADPDRAAIVSRGVIASWLTMLFRNAEGPRYTAPELVWQIAAQ